MSLISSLRDQSLRPYYWQHGNIAGRLYRRLLTASLDGGVMFIVRPETTSALVGRIDQWRQGNLEMQVTDRWPGTITSIPSTVYAISGGLSPENPDIPRSLLGWRAPDFPEDLAIYNSSGQLWFFSTTHESNWFAAPEFCPPDFRGALLDIVRDRPILGAET